MPQQSQAIVPRRFEEYSPEKYNILYPSRQLLELSPLQKIVIEEVTIDTGPQSKDIFRVGSTKVGDTWIEQYALAKPAIEKVARAARITFDPHSSHRIDDASNPDRVEFQATGALKRPEGEWIVVTKTYEFNIQARCEELENSLQEKAKKGYLTVGEGQNKKTLAFGTAEATAEIARRVRDEKVQLRKFAVSRADTGACNRVIRSLLALKGTYTKEELSKTFVVPHVSINTEFLLADPQTRQLLIQQALASTSEVFGPKSTASQHQLAVGQMIQAAEVQIPDEPEYVTELKEPPPKEVVTEAEYREAWFGKRPEERIMEIDRLIKLKKYIPKEGSWPPEQLDTKTQVSYLWFLNNLPMPPGGVAPGEQTKLPF